MKILSGIVARQHYLEKLAQEIKTLKQKGIIPTLATILNNDTYASATYVNNKKKLCDQLGIKNILYKLDQATTNQQMIQLVQEINQNPQIHGLFVQLPTSNQINDDLIISHIDPNKDVDCFHNYNVGKIWTSCQLNDNLIKPCTPAGIIALLKYYQIEIASKNVVIVNRSNIVGKPLAALFLQENATVTICHSKTKNLKNFTRQADIVIAAIGKAKFFDQTYFNNQAIIIDVGINRDLNNNVCGDVDLACFDQNFQGAISPVPGGVGPMTLLMLVNNLIVLTKKQIQQTKSEK